MKKHLFTWLTVCLATLLMPDLAFANHSESHFEKWVTKRTNELDQEGEIFQSTTGPLQYIWKGNKKHPVILSFHGAFGGWDQSLLIASHFLDHGFSVLAISRPGYLSSALGGPLPPGISNEVQADEIIALLDFLNIDRVASLGFSAGAPVAYLLAQRHPERVWALVLESIGANIPQDIPFYELLTAILSTGDLNSADFETYMMNLTAEEDLYSIGKEIFAADSDLSIRHLKERIEYVKSHHDQSKFLKHLILSFSPISPRVIGAENDIANIGQFPLLPYTGFSTPTRIVQAINDVIGNFSTAEFVNEQINVQQEGLSRLIHVHESGHFVWLGEHTKDWEKKVVKFLKQHRP
jgi:pimeloyl-ACP methyl ester carboxylesterase